METAARYKGMSLTARQKVRNTSQAESGGTPGRADTVLRSKNEASLHAYSTQEFHFTPPHTTTTKGIVMTQQVEVVYPKLTGDEFVTRLFTGLTMLAWRVLFIWWAVAVWFPEWGLTYWQLVLPVYAARLLFDSEPYRRTAKS